MALFDGDCLGRLLCPQPGDRVLAWILADKRRAHQLFEFKVVAAMLLQLINIGRDFLIVFLSTQRWPAELHLKRFYDWMLANEITYLAPVGVSQFDHLSGLDPPLAFLDRRNRCARRFDDLGRFFLC